MPSWSMPTMWGGANLLDMHLKVMQELLQMKKDGKWNWDFVLNLSESDFPIKYDFENKFPSNKILLNYSIFKDLLKS
jgi:hypothetical protein